MVRTKDEGGTALERLRQFGLRYPGAHTKSPWPGHLDLAVNDKTFAYLSIAGEPLRISCKLPRSSDAALELPFTTPTAYGLGKSGWVTAEFPDGAGVPVELLEEWIDESYRAQAPKRLSAKLPPLGAAASGATMSAPSAKAKASGSKARAPTAGAAARGGSKRAPARAASKPAAKPSGVSPRAAKRPAKKRAKSRA
jgi:predicted DNA-binding protein (MmcQ/YjbR family)